jgi:hypothetical protein
MVIEVRRAFRVAHKGVSNNFIASRLLGVVLRSVRSASLTGLLLSPCPFSLLLSLPTLSIVIYLPQTSCLERTSHQGELFAVAPKATSSGVPVIWQLTRKTACMGIASDSGGEPRTKPFVSRFLGPHILLKSWCRHNANKSEIEQYSVDTVTTFPGGALDSSATSLILLG